MEKINAELTKAYGPPTEDYGYPEEIEGDGNAIDIAEWAANGKGAIMRIVRLSDGYQIEIDLYDVATKTAAEEAEWLKDNEEQ